MKDITQSDLTDNIPLCNSIDSNWLDDFLFVAGPCTVESQDQMFSIARKLVSQGVTHMRGGAYKPLTFPYRNDRMYELRERGLRLLHDVKMQFDLKIVSELTETKTVDLFQECVDVIQIGSRNMYNYELLVVAAKTNKPVLLKRHFGASMRDWLGAAEYILNAGNDKIILCERGITTPHTHSDTTRFISDIQVIPAIKKYTGLPVIFDPSHATFDSTIVEPMSYAAVAAGADGVMIETHPSPEHAAVDRLNCVTPDKCCDIHSNIDKLLSLRLV